MTSTTPAIVSITQHDYRDRDGEWAYYYEVAYSDGTTWETQSWHPSFAGHSITVVKG